LSGSSSLSTEEIGQTGPADKRPIRLCPDWICEILSPSTAVRDRVQKRNLYASHRVGLYWFVAVGERMLEAFALESGRWVLVGNYGDGDSARISPFEEVELEIDRLFPPTGPTAP
jgi:Uma2 family endonuclease